MAFPVDDVVVGERILTLDFGTFYRLHRQEIARTLALSLGDVQLADEAADEAMTRAFVHWKKVERMDNPQGWVYRVAFNWALSSLRRVRRAPRLKMVVESEEQPSVRDPHVQAALAALDVKHRSVVVCRHLLGWSEAQTASALGIRPGTVKSRLSRATAQLRSQLAPMIEESR
jgi:RNA polymerase sigma factor (sigma-70 family)